MKRSSTNEETADDKTLEMPLQDPEVEEEDPSIISISESSFHSSDVSEDHKSLEEEEEDEEDTGVMKGKLSSTEFKDSLKAWEIYQGVVPDDQPYLFILPKCHMDDETHVHNILEGYVYLTSPKKGDRTSFDEFFLRMLIYHNIVDEARLTRHDLQPSEESDSCSQEEKELPKLTTTILCAMIRWVEMHHKNKALAAHDIELAPKRTRSQTRTIIPYPLSMIDLQDYVRSILQIYNDAHPQLEKETLEKLSKYWQTQYFDRSEREGMSAFLKREWHVENIVDWTV